MRKLVSNTILVVMIMFNLTMVMCTRDNISQKDINIVLNKYESELMGVTKEDGKYNLCLLINMKAQATTLESDGVEEGYDTAEGIDVPVEVILIKKKGKFYIESIKEYNSLKIAQNENENFIKND